MARAKAGGSAPKPSAPPMARTYSTKQARHMPLANTGSGGSPLPAGVEAGFEQGLGLWSGFFPVCNCDLSHCNVGRCRS